MIVYGSGISDGDRHNHDDLPILLAGKGGGTIKTGRHLRVRAAAAQQPLPLDARPHGRADRSPRRQHGTVGAARRVGGARGDLRGRKAPGTARAAVKRWACPRRAFIAIPLRPVPFAPHPTLPHKGGGDGMWMALSRNKTREFADIEAARESKYVTLMAIPTELVPEVQALLASKESD